jgi:ATP-binding protein involved in chromosome partitioning
MSIGFVVGDADTLLLDSWSSGHIIRQTMQEVLWGDVDLLIVDLPPGAGEPLQTLLKTIQMDGVVLVTTPQDLSLMDTSRSLGVFRQAGVPILGVVENMSGLSCPHCGQEIQLFHRSQRDWALEKSGLEMLGRVPMNLAISRPITLRHPLLQQDDDSDEAAPFREIASKLYRKLDLEEHGRAT